FIAVLGWGVGVVSAVVTDALKRWWFAPSLALTFGEGAEYHTRTDEYYKDAAEDARPHPAIFIRAKVVNETSSLAKGCRAYLTNIERKDAAGFFVATAYAESFQLQWASQDEAGSFGPIDLPQNVPHFIDIVSARQQPTARFQPHFKTYPLRYADLFSTE